MAWNAKVEPTTAEKRAAIAQILQNKDGVAVPWDRTSLGTKEELAAAILRKNQPAPAAPERDPTWIQRGFNAGNAALWDTAKAAGSSIADFAQRPFSRTVEAAQAIGSLGQPMVDAGKYVLDSVGGSVEGAKRMSGPGGYVSPDDAMIGDVTDAYMAVMAGGSPGAAMRKGSTLGAGGGRVGKSALPMDEASRMARAREMGLTKNVYHGTPRPIDKFEERGLGIHVGTKGQADSIIKHGPTAKIVSGQEYAPNSSVMPLVTKNGKYLELEDPGSHLWDANELLSQLAWVKTKDFPDGITLNFKDKFNPTLDEIRMGLMEKGYDGISYKNIIEGNGRDRSYIIFNPKNIRSKFAAFDPAKSDSPNLLAAGGNRKAGAGYAAVRSDADEGIRAYHGSPHDFPPAGASAKKAAMPKIGSFDATPKGKMIGYRVVNLDDSGNIVSQADSRVKLSPGGEHNVPMFVSNSPDYVLDYYGHGAWGEAGETRQALLAYEFDPSDILKGNLEDAQPELSIKRGKLLSMKEITDEAAANSLRTLAK